MSLDGTYLQELRTRCTRQRCATASGNIAHRPSASPDTPSMLTNSTSSTPRWRSSSNTPIQWCAPSASCIHSPSMDWLYWIGYIFLDDPGRTEPAFLNSTGVMYPSVECILELLRQCT